MARVLLPDFLMIGAEKTGATSLFRYVRQHPQVFMPPYSGANYFSCGDQDLSGRVGYSPHEYAMTWDAYRDLFVAAPAGALVGESSPSYLCHERAAGRIAGRLPEAKLIVLLRQPADRALSHFMFNRKKANEPSAHFSAALDEEPGRTERGWHYRFHYRRNGFYTKQLRPYFDHFPREHISVHLYDDFVSDPAGLLRGVFQFIGVDDSFMPDRSVDFNVSGVPRNRAVELLLRAIHPWRTLFERTLPPRLVSAIGNRLLERPPRDLALRQALTDEYRDEIRHLQEMIGRDLSTWLTPR